MDGQEYLASFGLAGDFGRFRAAVPLPLRRGERVVVRGPRGVEIAAILREAVPGHAHFLPNTSVGQLLRRFSSDDEQTETRLQARGQQLFERGRQLAVEMQLPLELIDVELLFDGEHALLHHLRWEDADVRPFVSTLSREFALHIALIDLTGSREPADHEESEEHAGCGKPNCGQEGGGGCSSCGSGGCGTCGTAPPSEMQTHRTALL